MSGGSYNGEDLESVEVLLTNGTRLCSGPDLPVGRSEHTNDGFSFCGGSGEANLQSCVSLTVNGRSEAVDVTQKWN